jgi:hypothetical protein
VTEPDGAPLSRDAAAVYLGKTSHFPAGDHDDARPEWDTPPPAEELVAGQRAERQHRQICEEQPGRGAELRPRCNKAAMRICAGPFHRQQYRTGPFAADPHSRICVGGDPGGGDMSRSWKPLPGTRIKRQSSRDSSPRTQRRVCATRFAPDSALEESGFELVVPSSKRPVLRPR